MLKTKTEKNTNVSEVAKLRAELAAANDVLNRVKDLAKVVEEKMRFNGEIKLGGEVIKYDVNTEPVDDVLRLQLIGMVAGMYANTPSWKRITNMDEVIKSLPVVIAVPASEKGELMYLAVQDIPQDVQSLTEIAAYNDFSKQVGFWMPLPTTIQSESVNFNVMKGVTPFDPTENVCH